MFPIGFSGKPGAKHRTTARVLKEALLKRGYTVTWASLTSPLMKDTNRLIDFIRDEVQGSRGNKDVVNTLFEQEQFSWSDAAQLQILALQDLGERHKIHGYPMDNPFMLEAAQIIRESKASRDQGYYLRQTLQAVDLSTDFMIAPDVKSPHEATWFADNGIVLRFLPVATEADQNRSLDELEEFCEFYGRFRFTEFHADEFVDELEKIREADRAYIF